MRGKKSRDIVVVGAPEGVSHDPQGQLHLVELLNCWAKVIEINLDSFVKTPRQAGARQG